MARFGVTNIYLLVGLGLLAVSAILAAWIFFQPAAIAHSDMRFRVAYGSFIAGLVLYVIGRVTLVMQRRPQA
ncbi:MULTISPECIES: hypothetical protein [unclassified Luteimonas]|uniref:hypothetical protein n=1 Tax=unclassified Luteimonas TaxID=2629088 RepID=UPI0018F06F85|nr:MULTISPECIES: hypothetical protein [unclassified Luteimonas]MBJ6979733.1 hypothetical protein [Luteimonas sp. MC1895]MBJ6985576.1 hypothetical protein [Luteimonas sp. MC1750]QQO05942.1 hypothetical protein JGR68_00295 [Luteimonas sp. MC1750]